MSYQILGRSNEPQCKVGLMLILASLWQELPTPKEQMSSSFAEFHLGTAKTTNVINLERALTIAIENVHYSFKRMFEPPVR